MRPAAALYFSSHYVRCERVLQMLCQTRFCWALHAHHPKTRTLQLLVHMQNRSRWDLQDDWNYDVEVSSFSSCYLYFRTIHRRRKMWQSPWDIASSHSTRMNAGQQSYRLHARHHFQRPLGHSGNLSLSALVYWPPQIGQACSGSRAAFLESQRRRANSMDQEDDL